MKKILVVCAALLLPCFLVRAQEADDTGTGVGLSVIPRLDLSFDDGQFTLGNSSIYTLFEGNITEHLSFSVENHWAGFYDVSDIFGATKELYQNTLKRQSTPDADTLRHFGCRPEIRHQVPFAMDEFEIEDGEIVDQLVNAILLFLSRN